MSVAPEPRAASARLTASAQQAKRSWAARAERAALGCMGLGLALMLLVPIPWAFRTGFFVVLGATVVQIVSSHARASRP